MHAFANEHSNEEAICAILWPCSQTPLTCNVHVLEMYTILNTQDLIQVYTCALDTNAATASG